MLLYWESDSFSFFDNQGVIWNWCQKCQQLTQLPIVKPKKNWERRLKIDN